jgi:NADP-dependent 3-hydroxy acid dehydrogenase YdfG
MSQPVAVVTGASSGIGAATTVRLRKAGYHVFAAARRVDRLARLAEETGAEPVALDVTDDDSVRALAEAVPECRVLVCCAGGAIAQDTVATEPIRAWERMFDVNALGTLRVVQALLPKLRAAERADVVVVTSLGGHSVYPGGGGYSASKHAQRVLTGTLRQELRGEPIRVVEIAPGMVRTEFMHTRFEDDPERADQAYGRVPEPLAAEDIAECVTWAVSQPPRMTVELVQVSPWF